MSFYIPETNETISALHRPITIITSNAEKEYRMLSCGAVFSILLSFPHRS